MASTYLDQRQLSGLAKAGDILIPGDGEMPSFTQAGCIEYVDRVAAYMTDKDRTDFISLMGLFAALPRFLVHGLLALSSLGQSIPGPVGAPLRMLELGVKGVVMTLYYSDLRSESYRGRTVFDFIGWDARIVSKASESGDPPATRQA